jgi:hypothetical protein
MENEVKEDVVLNADEASAEGSALANEGSGEIVAESEGSSNEGEPAEFDPRAFMDAEEVVEDNAETKETTENVNDDNTAATKDDNGDLVWPDVSSSEDGKEGEQASEESSAEGDQAEVKDNVEENQPGEAVELTNDHFKKFASELGLEAESLDEIKNSLEGIIQENKSLKEEIKYSGNTNKKIEDLENFLKLDDETLMRKSLEADGLKGDKLDNAIDKYMDTGLLDVEALKVRSTLERTIQGERQSIVKAQEADVAKQQESRTESVKSFTEYMQSQESVFDMKLTGS